MRIVAVIAVLALSSGADADRPPLSPGRIALETAAGAIATVVGAYGGAVLGYEAPAVVSCHDCRYAGQQWGTMVGPILVAPIGVYLAGRTGSDTTGSLGFTYLGALVGGTYGLIALARDDSRSPPLPYVALFAPAVGAVVGYNATLRYREGHSPMRVVPTTSGTPGGAMVGVAGVF